MIKQKNPDGRHAKDFGSQSLKICRSSTTLGGNFSLCSQSSNEATDTPSYYGIRNMNM
jgi:hypothetical protein